MNDSFFISSASKKRSRSVKETKRNQKQQAPPSPPHASEEEEHDIDDDMDAESPPSSDDSTDHSDDETAQEKRIRLAKSYLNGIEKEKGSIPGEFDAGEIDRDLIAERLQNDAMEEKGGVFHNLADRCRDLEGSAQLLEPISVRGHTSSVTCAAIHPSENYVYSGGKDGLLIQWNLTNGLRLSTTRLPPLPVKKAQRKPKISCVNCMAVSPDGLYLAVGSADRLVRLWSIDLETGVLKLRTTFNQHRDEITAVAFQPGNHTTVLYTASSDRTIKLFNIEVMSYVETLFGHQDSIGALACFPNRGVERCLSVGTRDRSVRVWKIMEESQLVYRASSSHVIKHIGGSGVADAMMQFAHLDMTNSVDTVFALDAHRFVTGSDGGTLSMWQSQRKKPVAIMSGCHGWTFKVDASDVWVDWKGDYEGSASIDQIFPDQLTQANWITAITGVPNSDLIITGSWDGRVRFWKLKSPSDDENYDDSSSQVESGSPSKSFGFTQVAELKVIGCVNSLDISTSRRHLVVGVGQELKRGRWISLKQARNGLRIFDLAYFLQENTAS